MQTCLLICLLIITVVSSLSVLNVNAIIVNNTDFSINVLDNWAYLESKSNIPLAKIFAGDSPLFLIPVEFSKLLLMNSTQFDSEESNRIQDEGAFALIALDTDYPFRNVPLEIYTQYNNNLSKVKIFSQENATVGGEKAVKIHRTPRHNSTNMEVVEYYVVHEGKPYYIQYGANLKHFQKYLPQFEQMVKTFKFPK
jgi:hypothetical protein